MWKNELKSSNHWEGKNKAGTRRKIEESGASHSIARKKLGKGTWRTDAKDPQMDYLRRETGKQAKIITGTKRKRAV